VRAHLSDDEAVAAVGGQPGRGELAKCFAHGSSADRRSARDPVFHETLPGNEVSIADRVAQIDEDLI
jgi:hypothetical protein